MNFKKIILINMKMIVNISIKANIQFISIRYRNCKSAVYNIKQNNVHSDYAP